jgi:curved DNA-binding protein CbpA
MVRDTTLYDRIGVSPNASQEEINTAYRKKSKLVHPDRFTDEKEKEEATIKFQELGQAKDILLNEEKRQIYNQIGMDIFKNGMDQDDGPGHGPDMGEFFANIFSHQGFGGIPGFMGQRQRHE